MDTFGKYVKIFSKRLSMPAEAYLQKTRPVGCIEGYSLKTYQIYKIAAMLLFQHCLSVWCFPSIGWQHSKTSEEFISQMWMILKRNWCLIVRRYYMTALQLYARNAQRSFERYVLYYTAFIELWSYYTSTERFVLFWAGYGSGFQTDLFILWVDFCPKILRDQSQL